MVCTSRICRGWHRDGQIAVAQSAEIKGTLTAIAPNRDRDRTSVSAVENLPSIHIELSVA
jgi:hypothetical protein